MRAVVKQFHKGSQLPIPSGDSTKLGMLLITPGSYLVFAKADIMAQASGEGLAHVQVALRFTDPNGSRVEDETTHQWANPRNSNHRTATIALNIGVRFELTLEHLGSSGEFRPVELIAFANRDNVMSASNVTITAIAVDELLNEFLV